MSAPAILTTQEEARLAALIQAGRRASGQTTAKARLAVRAGKQAEDAYITGNLRLVYSLAHKFQRMAPVDLDDLIQEGTLGLMHALRKFDWGRGTKFSTYAAPWIMKYIKAAIANQRRLIRVPLEVDQQIARVGRVRELLSIDLGRLPTDAEVAAELGITVQRVQELEHYNEPMLSLSEPSSGVDVPANVEDDDEPSPAPDVTYLLDRLSSHEREVIEMRYGLGEQTPQDRDEMAAVLHIGTEAIRRREWMAMKKMRAAA